MKKETNWRMEGYCGSCGYYRYCGYCHRKMGECIPAQYKENDIFSYNEERNKLTDGRILRILRILQILWILPP